MNANFISSDINRNHIKGLIQVHKKEIEGGFLSSLGDTALELIFRNASSSSSGILIAALDKDNECIGFICGTTSVRNFYMDFFKKYSIIAAVFLGPKLLSVSKIKKVIETLLYPSKKENLELPDAELLDLAVNSNYQGTGLAQQLFEKFKLEMVELGHTEFKITTGQELIRAQKFYEKLGATKSHEIQLHDGPKTYVYIYNCN